MSFASRLPSPFGIPCWTFLVRHSIFIIPHSVLAGGPGCWQPGSRSDKRRLADQRCLLPFDPAARDTSCGFAAPVTNNRGHPAANRCIIGERTAWQPVIVEERMSTKDAVIEMIKRLPEEVTVSDIMAELYLRLKVDEGLQQLDAGEGIPHEQAKKKLAKWVN